MSSPKQPTTTASFRAKFASRLTNPEEDWIQSEELTAAAIKTVAHSQTRHTQQESRSSRMGGKTAVEMMQDMLRCSSNKQAVNPYYSRQSQERLGSLLTNEYRRNTYINSLEAELPRLPPAAAKNYRLLMLLLQEVAKNDIEVTSTTHGIQLAFNQKVLDNQEMLLERLRREQDAREQEQQRIVQEYEDIIARFQTATEQLVQSSEQAESHTKP